MGAYSSFYWRGGGIGKIRIFGSFSGKIRISRGKNWGFREKIVGNLGFLGAKKLQNWVKCQIFTKNLGKQLYFQGNISLVP